MHNRFTYLLVACAGLWAGAAAAEPAQLAQAAAYPVSGKPIEIIVPYAPGGGVDFSARLMAAALEKELPGTVVVINKDGAGGQVGITALSQAKPDGYTLGYVVLPTIITHYLDATRKAVYTPKNFQTIGAHFSSNYALNVLKDSKYKTLKEFVDAARAAPNTLSVSDSGLMATPHLMTSQLEHVAGIKLKSVHYKGGAPSVQALMSGETAALAGGGSDTVPYLDKIRVLGISAPQEDPLMPGPTMKSQGFDVSAGSIAGIMAPAGVPADIVAKLTQAMKKIIADPQHAKTLMDRGSGPHYLDPVAYRAYWDDNEKRLAPILPALLEAAK